MIMIVFFLKIETIKHLKIPENLITTKFKNQAIRLFN